MTSETPNIPASESQAPEATERKFYDQGWNAFIDNEPFTFKSTIDWQDGWKDCNEAASIHRKKI